MFDTHVHTTFSPDGRSGMDEYISLIDSGKLEGIGFSEHLDFMPCCGGYEFLNYPEYSRRINYFRQKGYKIFAGAEIDYAAEVEDAILRTLKQKHFDYNICSVHMIDHQAVSDKLEHELLQDSHLFGKMLEGYYGQVTSSLKVKEFNTIGHIGIYTRYIDHGFFLTHPLRKRMEELSNALAKACAESGKIIEINTSGLFNPIRSTIPNKEFLTAFFQYGGRQISIGSDAHQVQHTARGFDTAAQLLKEIGFQWITYPWESNIQVPL